jgi:large subunit ribosomal protein L25
VSTSTRPRLAAEHRTITGKKVATLRRAGILPAVVYGHGHVSEAIQIDAKEFETLRRHAGRNAILDLKIGASRATPVILQHVTEHPVQRVPIHADFFVVEMSEEMIVDVPISFVGESDAIKKLGGSLLHQRETVSVRALPDALPSTIEVDISGMEDFEAAIHVSDVVAPAGVTILTDGAEPLARIQAPRQSDEPVIPGPTAPVQEEEATEEASS